MFSNSSSSPTLSSPLPSLSSLFSFPLSAHQAANQTRILIVLTSKNDMVASAVDLEAYGIDRDELIRYGALRYNVEDEAEEILGGAQSAAAEDGVRGEEGDAELTQIKSERDRRKKQRVQVPLIIFPLCIPQSLTGLI